MVHFLQWRMPLADACDIRIFHPPLTAERVLEALEEKHRQEVKP